MLRAHTILICIVLLHLCFALAGTVGVARAGEVTSPKLEFQSADVVAFVGGGDVSAAQFAGHLDALLAIRFHDLGINCRNFGWEGDTVFRQSRDVGFPALKVHLQRAKATVTIIQYGRAEALDGRTNLGAFVQAYERILDDLMSQTKRLVLVTPPPFENGGGHLPDLTRHNGDLEAFSQAIVALAERRQLPAIDIFAQFGGKSHRGMELTSDGLQLTSRGQGLEAIAFARAAGFGDMAKRAGRLDPDGRWSDAAFERVRQAVVAKNRFWFEYWRPQNWAFLGGDRTEQPSSRDYRDPKIRWFPSEMEKFVPLIRDAEKVIQEAAGAAQNR